MTGHTDIAHPAGAHAGPAESVRVTTSRRPAAGLLARAGALLVALFFVAHGLAHLVGVLEIFGLGGEAANTSSLVPGLDPGSPAFLALGAVWVVALALFVAAAAGIVLKRGWWLPLAFAAALVSLAACIVWYEAAVVGLVVNLVILAGLVVFTAVSRRAAR